MPPNPSDHSGPGPGSFLQTAREWTVGILVLSGIALWTIVIFQQLERFIHE